MLWTLLLLQAGGSPSLERTIEVGITAHSLIEASDPEVTTTRIEQEYPPIPLRAKRFRFQAPGTGRYTIDMRSLEFDACILLLDSERQLLKEDDDSIPLTQARLTVDLEEGKSYLIDAVAGHGAVGTFELLVTKGAPPAMSVEERGVWENDSRAMASILRLRAINFFEAGKMAEASQLFSKALDIVKERLHGVGHESAACFHSFGRFLVRQGQLSHARSMFEQAIQIQETLLGPEDLQTCQSYADLGNVIDKMGETSAACELFKKSLRAFEREASHGISAKIRYYARRRCAEVALCLGEWLPCENLLIECIDEAQKIFGLDSESAVEDLALLGTCELLQGKRAQAKLHFQRALMIAASHSRKKGPATWEIRMRFARALAFEGNIDEARSLLEQNLQEMKLSDALESLDFANTYSALGDLFEAAGMRGKAREAYERALNVFEKRLGDANDSIVEITRSLAKIAMESLDLDRAAEMLRRAQVVVERGAGSSFALLAKVRVLGEFGRLRFFEGKFEESQEYYEDCLDLLKSASANTGGRDAALLHDLACLRFESGDFRGAWDAAVASYKAAEQNIIEVTRSLNEPERYTYVVNQRIALETLLAFAPSCGDPENLGFAFDALSSWKGRVFQGALSAKQRIFQTRDRETRILLEKLREVQSQISALFTFQDPKEIPIAAQRMESLQRVRGDLEREITMRCTLPEDRPIPWRELQAMLPPGSSFVSFIEHRPYKPARRKDGRVIERESWGEPEVSAWILNSDSQHPVHVGIGSSTQLEALVLAYLGEILADKRPKGSVGSSQRTKRNGEVLDRIWRPIATQIRGDLIFVSSDACIGSLPFGVVQQENGRFLVEDRSFVCMQEVGGLRKLTQKSRLKGGSLLVVGGVDFQSLDSKDRSKKLHAPVEERESREQTRSAWPPLRATREEASAILQAHERNFPELGRLFLEGSGPTEETLKKELPRFSFLHIASHGFFNPDGLESFWDQVRVVQTQEWQQRIVSRPHFQGFMPGLLSGLVCAGANLESRPNRENGLLTAEEVSWLDLSRCQLVVLSACETGLGAVRGGEGIVGLRSAFRQAGAKTVISSLWSVGDESTKEFMRRFYSALWCDGRGPQEALRQAQLELIAEQRKLFDGQAFPYAWGAFVLDGESQ